MKPKQRKNKTKLPQTALAFYIKLYCDRKVSKETKYHCNLVEATKSWLSLSECEKQQFQTKYMECVEKYKLNVFRQLKNAKPFMKVKTGSIIESTSSIVNHNLQNNDNEGHVENIIPITEEEQAEQINTDKQLLCGSEGFNAPTPLGLQEHQDDQNDNEEEVIDRNDTIPMMPSLVEPLPPTINHHLLTEEQSSFEQNKTINLAMYNILQRVMFNIDNKIPVCAICKRQIAEMKVLNLELSSLKEQYYGTGHELYCILNSTDKNNTNSWKSLPLIEKNQYSRAVSIMKKDYIFKYKEYLESLTPKELFDCYNKTIF